MLEVPKETEATLQFDLRLASMSALQWSPIFWYQLIISHILALDESMAHFLKQTQDTFVVMESILHFNWLILNIAKQSCFPIFLYFQIVCRLKSANYWFNIYAFFLLQKTCTLFEGNLPYLNLVCILSWHLPIKSPHYLIFKMIVPFGKKQAFWHDNTEPRNTDLLHLPFPGCMEHFQVNLKFKHTAMISHIRTTKKEKDKPTRISLQQWGFVVMWTYWHHTGMNQTNNVINTFALALIINQERYCLSLLKYLWHTPGRFHTYSLQQLNQQLKISIIKQIIKDNSKIDFKKF